MSYLHPNAVEAAIAHALREFPKEACGYVVDSAYLPCTNYALPAEMHKNEPGCDCQLCSFRMAPEDGMRALEMGEVRAILHSHPGGPLYPSAADMRSQIDTDLAWGIIATDGEQAGLSALWGDQVPMKPLIGREFMHGVADCYTLIRDTYRLGREKLKQREHLGGDPDGIDWPFDPILLPEVARNDNWWKNGDNLYDTHFQKFGFKEIAFSDVKPGDIFLIPIGDRETNPQKQLNHGGLYVGNNLIMHHLPGRCSRREPAGLWGRSAEMWIRYDA